MRRREASWRTRHNSEPWSDKSVLDAWMKTLWEAVGIMTFMRNMVFSSWLCLFRPHGLAVFLSIRASLKLTHSEAAEKMSDAAVGGHWVRNF